MRALVVDDIRPMNDLLKKMLRQTHYFDTVDSAYDGEDAWEKILLAFGSKAPYDMVFCDVKMEGLDGLGLLKRRRNHPNFRFLPFLMISASSEEANIVSALGEWEANDFLVKPFSLEVLAQRVKAILKRVQSPEEILFRQAEQLKSMGAARDALELIEKAEAESRLSLAKWINAKGECLAQSGDMEGAVAEFKKSMEIGKIYITAYKNFAAGQQKLGNYDEAVEALKYAESISPKDNDRTMLLGSLLLKTGHKEQAKKYLESAIKRSDENERANALRQVAEMYLEAGMYDEAEIKFVASLEFSPEDVEIYNRIGLTLRKQKKYDEALQCYQQILKIRPDHPGIYYNMGILFMARGDYGTAQKHFEKALSKDPQLEAAKAMLRKIEEAKRDKV
jgi:tetratricopeptide (TPR) repeat protein